MILSGGVYVPPAAIDDLQHAAAAPASARSAGGEPKLSQLTTRQREVIDLIAKGLTNKEIAGVLEIAEGTVKVHAAAAYETLEVTNRTEAAVVLRELLSESD